jgi:hypothetical protein
MRADAVLLQKNGVADPTRDSATGGVIHAERPTALKAAIGLVAGITVQVAFFYFWQVFLRGAVGPWVLPFGRTPDQVVAMLLPFLGGLVAASYHPRGWWWLGQGLAFPAFWSMHLLFSAGLEIAYSRPPTLSEEGRFLLMEGHRLLAGLVGGYLGALLQRD